MNEKNSTKKTTKPKTSSQRPNSKKPSTNKKGPRTSSPKTNNKSKKPSTNKRSPRKPKETKQEVTKQEVVEENTTTNGVVESKEAEANTQKIEEVHAELTQATGPFSEWSWLSDDIKEGLAKIGFSEPTPVQSGVIEPAIKGHDLIVQAKTGSGKTAAFGIPLVEMISAGHEHPKALIMAPTRELTRQVCDVLSDISQVRGSRVVALYGGIKYQEQIRELNKGADIVVGSPGRLLDLINRGHLSLDDVEYIGLDEADEMLSQGFYQEVINLMEMCKNRKQLLLFSATISDTVERVINKYAKNPYRLMIEGDSRKVDGIQHVIYFYNGQLTGPRNLLYLLEAEQPESAIIFCNQKNTSDMIAKYLTAQGKQAQAIHGDMDQKERERILKALKYNEIQYMVATDLAARGIDISDLSHVINYDFPPAAETYIHRCGRTGRYDKKGICINIFRGHAISALRQLREDNILFETRELPPVKDIIKRAASSHIEKIYNEATSSLIEDFLPLTDVVSSDPRGRLIFSYLLKLYHQGAFENEATPTA